jgi:predicted ATPase
VDKFIGDGVMGVWGSPTAHEDDPERAVRAALDLLTDVATLSAERAIPDLALRVGIATGKAAVIIAPQGQRLFAGDIVNTASRLEAAAPPGGVLVDQVTYQAADGAISFRSADELQLKGKSGSVAVWRPLHVVAMVGGAGRAEGLEPPFVGRAAEMQLLKDLFRSTARDGRAHLVSIQGIPGIGKSRLVWEFQKHLDGLVETVFWHQGRSPSYGEGITFWALGEMVRQRAGIAEIDDPIATDTRLTEILDEFIPSEDRRWVEPALRVLLGLDAESRDRDELFSAWRTFFERIAERSPTVLVFEDLQWADEGLLDFVESLLEWSRDHAIFLVTLARPELFDRRPAWGAGQRGFTTLHLEPLSRAAMEELLEGLVPGLPESLSEKILARADGVPLYAVETVRMLIGHGSLKSTHDGYRLTETPVELAVPESLHALVAARLDGLDPDDRRLLQDASVLGQSFTAKALAAITVLSPGEIEERLNPLVRREILTLERDPRSPERGQYRFVQSVIREVAYSTLGRSDRSRLHPEVARYLQALGDEELAGAIASHYVEAFEAEPEPSQAELLAESARSALRSAADRAEALGSHGQAIAYWERSMEVTADPAELVILWRRAAAAAEAAGRFDLAEGYLRKAIDWYESRDDTEPAALATAHLGSVLLRQSRVEEAISALEAALEALGEATANPPVPEVTAQLARAYAFHGEGQKSLSYVERALEAAAPLDLVEVIADALITRGLALTLLGREQEGLAVTEGALSLAQRHGLSVTEIRARNNVCAYTLWSDPHRSLEASRPGYQLAQRLGNLEWTTSIGTRVAAGLISTGDWDEALTIIEEIRRPDVSFFSRLFLDLTTAELLANRGDHAAAAALLDELRPLVEESTSEQDRSGFTVWSGYVALARGDAEAALELALETASRSSHAQHKYWASELATEASIRLQDAAAVSETLDRWRGIGRKTRRGDANLLTCEAALAALEDRTKEAVSRFEAAFAAWRALDLQWPLALCQLACVELLGTDHETGREAAEEARHILTALRANPFLERLETAVG